MQFQKRNNLRSRTWLAVFTLLGVSGHTHFWSQWWFYVGVGMSLAVVFVEPFYGARPRCNLQRHRRRRRVGIC